MAHSGEALRAARDTLLMGYRGVAVNRAYYAAYYAACSVIAASRGRIPKTHKDLAQRFGQVVVVNSEFPPEVARSLSTLASLREQSDYDIGDAAGLDDEEVAGLIETASVFVAEVRDWLDRHSKK